MRDLLLIFGCVIFFVCGAASITSLTDGDTGSTTNGLLLAAGAGVGFWAILTALVLDRR